MDETNLKTPMVIQVPSCEEQTEQTLYEMDLDELETSKDYVIDQIFCGENLTIYALFEISDLSGRKSEKHLIEVSDSSTNDEFKFYHRSSFKKSIKDKGFKRFKSNYKNFSSGDIEELLKNDRNQMTESYYCLKNYDGQYEVTRGGDDSPDLKVLYSKNQNIRKFKFVSKGVNTDIAQCPKLVDDVRKAISISKPYTKDDGKTIEIEAFPPVKSSYELIEMETAPSSSTCCSDMEDYKRHYQKPSPNILLVPLLMMDETMLNTLKSEDKNQNNKEVTCPPSEKVSFGTNTDFSCSEFLGRLNDSEKEQESNSEHSGTKNSNSSRETEKVENESKGSDKNEENHETESEPNLPSKQIILKEIKNLQDKLNIIIKSLESSECKDSSKLEKSLEERSPSAMEIAECSVQRVESDTESKPVKRNQRRYDDLPIFSPDTLNTPLSKMSRVRKKPSSAERERRKEVLPVQAKSTISILTTSESSILRTPFVRNRNKVRETERLEKKQSYWTNFNKCNKTLPVSKSESSVQFRLFAPHSKCGLPVGLRKTVSYELAEEKTDGVGTKKMKCASLKIDGNFKSKNHVRVHSNNESVLPSNITPLNCEMGDEIGKKLKQDILVLEQKINEDEGLLKVLVKDTLSADLKKTTQNVEEGDAKIPYETAPFSIPFTQKNERVVVNYCSTNGDSTLKKEKSFKKLTGQLRIKSGLSIDVEPKVSTPMDTKPTTPNKNDKKLNTETNAKKEVKTSVLYKSKIPDKINKNVKKEIGQPETAKRRSLTMNRPKSGGQPKPHVDKPIKKTPANANETTSNKPQPKSEKDDKLNQHHIPRGIPKLQTELQKRREGIQSQNGNKEKETVASKTETFDLGQNQTKPEEHYSQRQDFEEAKTVPEDKSQVTNSLTEPSSAGVAKTNVPNVVVELFSKKQSSMSESHTEFEQGFTTGPETDTSHIGLLDNDVPESTDATLQEGVKSVWALTKVLLYGDGTKKFEVLEVSLTPPECSLNNEKLNDQKPGKKKIDT